MSLYKKYIDHRTFTMHGLAVAVLVFLCLGFALPTRTIALAQQPVQVAVIPGTTGGGNGAASPVNSTAAPTVTSTGFTPGCYTQTPNSDGGPIFSQVACNGAVDAQDCYVVESVNGTNEDIPAESCAALACQNSSTAVGVDCSPQDSSSASCTSQSGDSLCNTIVQNYINPIILFLGAGVGLVIVIMVVVGGIQYITSGGDPNHVNEAKKRIANALIALVTFGLIWALLEWIIPDGIFH